MNDIQSAIVDVQLILRRSGQVLLLLRKNTGYEDGNFHLPAGHVMSYEDAITATIRETKEEIGITVFPNDMQFAGIVHRLADRPRTSFFFSTCKWYGMLTNCEPEKCGALVWYPIHDLPTNIVPFIRVALECQHTRPFCICFDWDSQESKVCL